MSQHSSTEVVHHELGNQIVGDRLDAILADRDCSDQELAGIAAEHLAGEPLVPVRRVFHEPSEVLVRLIDGERTVCGDDRQCPGRARLPGELLEADCSEHQEEDAEDEQDPAPGFPSAVMRDADQQTAEDDTDGCCYVVEIELHVVSVFTATSIVV